MKSVLLKYESQIIRNLFPTDKQSLRFAHNVGEVVVVAVLPGVPLDRLHPAPHPQQLGQLQQSCQGYQLQLRDQRHSSAKQVP